MRFVQGALIAVLVAAVGVTLWTSDPDDREPASIGPESESAGEPLDPRRMGPRPERRADAARTVERNATSETRPHPVASDEASRTGAIEDPHAILVRGRAVDRSGHVIPDVELHLSGRTGPRVVAATSRADPSGWFEFELPHTHLGFPLERTVVHRLEAGQMIGVAGSVVFSKRLVLGIQDVGDVRIARVPTVARGAFEGAERTLEQVQLRLEVASGDGTWSEALGFGVHPHAESDFEVRALDGDGRYRLHVRANRCEPVAPIEFLSGELELTVRLVDADGR